MAMENGEENKRLEQRLYELMQMKNKNAYAEWKHFFEQEFTENVDISVMQILLEIVQAYPLKVDIVRLIIKTMTIRAQQYQSVQDSVRENLAVQIVKEAQAQIPQQTDTIENKGYGNRKRRRLFGILAACFVVLVIGIGIVTSIVNNARKKEILQQAVEYLDEKYGHSGYEAADLKLEEAYLSLDAKDKLKAYFITEKGKYDNIIYAIAEKRESDYTYFDNLQNKEIKRALQDEINTLTGRSEGKLLWNSISGSDGAMENGYFHERYDGDFDAFIEKETKVRESAQKKGSIEMDESDTAKNGKCNYYLPDLNIDTMEQRLTMEELPQDEKLQEILENCAEKYQMQMFGIVLPKKYFEVNVNHIREDNYRYLPTANIYKTEMQPEIPFLLMTGWYVGIPEKDELLLDVQSAAYTVKPVLVSDGVYAAPEKIKGNEKIYKASELEGSFITTDVPKSVELSDDQKEKAVSIRFRGNRELQEYLSLAIDKEACEIADGGYQIFITEYSGEEERTRELEALPYQDEYAYLGSGYAMDGEGYIFIEYPSYYDWDILPAVVTIVNF